MKEFNQKIITREKLSLYTETFGKNKNQACVFIAGAGAPCRFWTNSFCEYFMKKDFFIIRFDQRDTGLSSAIDFEKNPYDLDDLAHDIIDILNFYGIEKANIIGHSMGGYVSQWLAANYPNYVNKMAVISTGPIGETVDYNFQLTSQEKALSEKVWKELQGHRPTSNFDESIEGYINVWRLQNGTIDLDKQMAINYTKDLYFRSKHPPIFHPSFIAVINKTIANLKNRSSLLSAIKIPSLVIHGKKDTLLMPQVNGIPLALAIDNAELQLIPKMGHMMFNKELELTIAKRIIDFFNQKTL